MFGEVVHPNDRPGWCHDCSTTYGDVAIIVCRRCGKVLGGILPGPHDSGYVIKPNEVLHTKSCPHCTEDDGTQQVLKFPVEEFEKAMEIENGRKTV